MKLLKMKTINTILLVFTLLLTTMLVFPAPALAQSDNDGDQVVVGGNYRLRSGETITGNLIVLGGKAILEEDSRVYGDVFLTGGNLEVSGTIDGNIIAIGGTVNLLSEAVVKGDVNLTSASFSRSPDATVKGDIRNDVTNLDGLNLENLPSIILPQPPITEPLQTGFRFFTNLIWSALQILALSALAALVVLLVQKPTERVAKSIVAQPLIASGFGLLTIIVAPALLILLTITIILIPVGLIGILILTVALLFGWIAVGLEIGLRVEKALNQTWAPAITGGVGTLILTLITSIFGAVPCIGWVIPALIAIIGLGGVLISRFGTQMYSSNTTAVKPLIIDAHTDIEPEVEMTDQESLLNDEEIDSEDLN